MVLNQEEPLVDDVEAVAEPPPKSSADAFAVKVVFTVFVLMRAMDRVFLKDIQNALTLPKFNLVWANILWPFAIQIMTVIMMCGYIGLQRYQGNNQYTWRFFLPGNAAASSMGAVPLYQLALFSLGDQLNAAISAPPSTYLSLPVQSVMTNSIIVWMAIIGFFWIGSRFMQSHYLGIILVVVSILVQLAPQMNDLASFSQYTDNHGHIIQLQIGAMVLWYSMFFVSTLPGAVGNVYKQKILQSMDMDVWYATWWSGNFQIMWGWLCIPLMWIQLPGSEALAPSETFTVIGQTLSCFAGNVPEGLSPADTLTAQSCASSPPPYFWVIFYLSFNISFNICLLYLTKRMSAVWAQIATVMCLNLCSIFSQFHFLMGDGAKLMSFSDYLGLIIASMALWAYNMVPEGKTGDAPVGGSMVGDGVTNIIQQSSFVKP